MLSFLFSTSLSIISADERRFLSYMKQIGQFFTGDEYAFRYGVFLTNLRYIRDFNKNGKRGFSIGTTPFAHLTAPEFKVMLGLKKTREVRSGRKFAAKEGFKAPEELDWREKGVVTPIKDQGSCGSCWAFSAVCAQESAWAIEHSDLISLSESNLVDCLEDCDGCGGCYPYTAYDNIISAQDGKFMKEEDYPYVEEQQKCKYDSSKSITQIGSYEIVDMGNENALLQAVTQGVVSVCIDGSMTDFQLYKSGIYDDDVCSIWDLDHAVACVGYGKSGATDFWIIKNSWGEDWGESGYIRMVRGKNMCGITMMAVLPHTK